MNTSKNNVTIHGHHIEVTPALESNIHNMVIKLHDKFPQIITHINVILKIDSSTKPHSQSAEAELSIKGKKEQVFAKVITLDMYESIHKLKDKLEKQILKHKEKHNKPFN